MEFKGTKGKWEYFNDYRVNSEDGSMLCAIMYNSDSGHGILPTAEANARLISAAPELFEACKMARTEIAKGTADDLTVDILEKALLKALGENV